MPPLGVQTRAPVRTGELHKRLGVQMRAPVRTGELHKRLGVQMRAPVHTEWRGRSVAKSGFPFFSGVCYGI